MTTASPVHFAHNLELLRYPRTPHLEGSRLQVGDEGHAHVRYATLAGRYLVVEEKLDAANAAVSFSPAGELLLQSRGHYLTGGGRERQFNLMKQWVVAHEAWLLERLEDRYVMYGEWMYKKHVLFYDQLPHYFLEFDVYDRREDVFLSTSARAALLARGPVVSVPVLYAGLAPATLAELTALLGPSLARSHGWLEVFERIVRREGLDEARCRAQTDFSPLAEGLYLKVEEGDRTVGRLKWVRHTFVQAILESGSHHSEQPLVPNQLRAGVDIFAPVADRHWAPLESQHG